MPSPSVLILAGQREGVIDPLCAEAGITRKAVLPLLGRPMLNYVLEALEVAGLDAPFHVSGFDADYDVRLTQSPSAPGPAGSALAALEKDMCLPALLTTADHPLLTAEMLEVFLSEASRNDADFSVGLAEKSVIAPAYPNVKRTYLPFSDTPVSGCNLFYIANEKGLEAIRFWASAQHYRKRPLKLARQFGLGVFLRLLFRRLTLDGAFTYASNRMGIIAKPVLIPIAEAAIDVDKPTDKRLVEQILLARNQKG